MCGLTFHPVFCSFCSSHVVVVVVVVSSVGHDRRRSGGEPQLLAAEGRNRFLPFQLTAQRHGGNERSPAALRG